MKYIFFVGALAGIAPSILLLICERRSIRWFTLGLLLPLLFFNSTAINFFSHETYRGTSRGMEISIIYINALVMLISFAILRKRVRFFPEAGSWLYLGYFLLSLPAFLNAENWLFSFFELWKMVMIYLVYLAIYHYLEYSKGDFDIILYGIAAVVIYDFFVIVQQHLMGYYQVPGVFPHQNSLAMCMMMAGLLFFARYFNRRERFKSWFFLFTLMLATASLLRTYSRGAIFCYPIGGLLTFLVSMSRFSFRKMRLAALLVFCALVGVLLFLPRIIQRFESAPTSSGETRKNFAIAAMNMMQDKPFAGVGLNNWGIKINPPYNYSRHRDPKKGYTEDYKDGIVETIYLLVGAECGIPCLVMLILWFGYYWISSIRLMWKLKKSRYFYLPAGIFGALSGAYMQSTLEWILKQQINFMWLMIFFAFIGYLNKHGTELWLRENAQEQAARNARANIFQTAL